MPSATTLQARRRFLILGLVLAMVVSLGFAADDAGATTTDGLAPDDHRRSRLAWTPCFEDLAADFGVFYECATMRVPLDYDTPRESIDIEMVRIPATAEPRLGSVFLNPGGPGGSGIDFALFFGPAAPFIWGPVANQYDIVGFDPRGILRSDPLLCFDTFEDALQVFGPVPFPVTRDEVAFFERGDTLLDRACARHGTKVRDHMSTANVARDLDRMRAAVGDRYLNYVGLSYGSYLGQTYANLFPHRVGAVVIDGVLDPIAWANVDADVPFSVALRSDAGAQATFEEFTRQCDAAGETYCALAPNSRARIEALLERLRKEPILLTDPETGETFPYLYSFAVADMLGALYNPFGYADAAAFVAFLESQADPATLGLERQRMQEAVGLRHDPPGEREEYPNFVEGFPAVACQDTTNPRGHKAWFRAGKEALAEFGPFGEIWTWASSPCAVWSHFDEDVYKGPFATSTAHPMLIIGNLYDPATRYEGALTADGLLARSALITVDEPGHTSLGLNVCAGATTGAYLADPSDPSWSDAEIFCESGLNWFVQAGIAAAAEDFRAMFRSQLMDDIAFRP